MKAKRKYTRKIGTGKPLSLDARMQIATARTQTLVAERESLLNELTAISNAAAAARLALNT